VVVAYTAVQLHSGSFWGIQPWWYNKDT